MKNQKNILLICCIIFVLGIGLTIFLTSKKTDGEVIEVPLVTSVSKNTAYQQFIFQEYYYNENFDDIFNKESLYLEEDEKETELKDCTGAINFQDNQFLRKWDFRTSCGDSQNNMNSKFASLKKANQKIKVFKQIQDGYLLASDFEEKDKIELTKLDENLNVLWTKELNDATSEDAYFIPFDLLEVEDGYYLLGFASNVSGEDFISIHNNQEYFTFLARFDKNGDLKKILNFQSMTDKELTTMTTIMGYSNQNLYLNEGNNIVILKNEKELQVISNQDNLILSSINDKYYYGYKNDFKYQDDGILETVTSNIKIKDWQNKTIQNINMTDVKTCEEANCTINNVTSIKNNIVVELPKQIYIFDENGKVAKVIDYEKIADSNEHIGKKDIQIVKVIPQENSYNVISFLDNRYLYLEEYDLNHELKYSKLYDTTNLYSLNGSSEVKDITVENHKITISNAINKKYNGIVITKISE